MDDKTITFNEVPEAITVLIEKIGNLENMIEATLNSKPNEAVWMNVDELCAYLPAKPAKQTVYGWVCSKFIPYHKKGKKLQFLKSEIDEWLISDSKEKEDLEAAIEEQTMRIRNNIRRRSL
jgi:excisionase family DNA binding protein